LDVWCWLDLEEDKGYIVSICYYSLCWALIALNCFFICRVAFVLNKELKNDRVLVGKYVSKLKWYPLVQMLSLTPSTIAGIYLLGNNENDFYLVLLKSIFDSLTGLMFSIVYGFNPAVKSALSELWQKLTGRSKNRKESYESVQSRSLSLNDDSYVSRDLVNKSKMTMSNI
jgi:hypothetical protein